ncbi:hypothetical protein VYL96_07110 [Dietzia cinnamea]|nr:hypothetical protein [Dietzia cinnamea]
MHRVLEDGRDEGVPLGRHADPVAERGGRDVARFRDEVVHGHRL